MKMLKGVPERIIMHISGFTYASKIVKDLNLTYTHTTKVLKALEREKIITRLKTRSFVLISFTSKGVEVQKHLLILQKLLYGKRSVRRFENGKKI